MFLTISYNDKEIESIIYNHIHIVKSCARKIYLSIPQGFVEEEDLISEGLYALTKAAKSMILPNTLLLLHISS